MAAEEKHRWDLELHGVRHRVEVTGSFSRTISWFADDEQVAQKKSSDDNVVLRPGGAELLDDVAAALGEGAADKADVELASPAKELGVIGVKFTSLGRAKRVTWYGGQGDVSADAQALLGTGGIDLDPLPGSPAALREERIRLHPRRYAAIAVAGGVAKVVIPLLLGLIVVRLTISIPWPDWDLPSIPWPDWDLPSIPWPSIPWPDIDLPSIPWPDLSLPDWVRWLLDKAKFVWPILLAWGLARAEINRRRKQDALKAQLRADAQAAELARAKEEADASGGTRTGEGELPVDPAAKSDGADEDSTGDSPVVPR